MHWRHRLSRCAAFSRAERATNVLPVVYTGGITQPAGDAITFEFIGISEIARSLP
jgi:hypothetical protein